MPLKVLVCLLKKNEVSETARGYHRELDSQILMIFYSLDVRINALIELD